MSELQNYLRAYGVIVKLYAGGLLGYVLSPVLWLVYPGGVGWLVVLTTTARAESNYDPVAVGDNGQSVGIVQFFEATALELEAKGYFPTTTSPSLMAPFLPKANAAWRESPFWSGYYAARYVQASVLYDVRWLALGIPGVGMPLARRLWTHGPDDFTWSAGQLTGGVARVYVAASVAALVLPVGIYYAWRWYRGK